MTIDSQVKVLESVVEKIDTSIEKLTEVSNSIGKLLAVHDERINNLEKGTTRQESDFKELYLRLDNRLDSIKNSLDTKIQLYVEAEERTHKELMLGFELNNKALADRLTILEKWRWILLGAATTIGYIVNKITNLF